MKNLIYHVAVALLIATSLTTSAATIVSEVGGGNWNSPSTWSGGVVPGSLDDVVIAPGASMTVDSPAACLSLHLNAASQVGSRLTISTNGTLVVGEGAGLVNLGVNLLSVVQEFETTLEVNGTLRCGQVHMIARRIAGLDAECMLRVNGPQGLVEVDGDIIQDRNVVQGGLRNQIRFGASGLVRIKGTFIALDDGGIPAVSGPGTIEYFKDGPQDIAPFNYNHLMLSGSGTKTATGPIIVSGFLTIKDTASYAGPTPVYDINTKVIYAGSVAQSSGPELPLLAPLGWGLTISNVLGVTLNQSVSVPGVIELSTGAATTGTNVLEMMGTLTRMDGYVIGNLQKTVHSGSNVATLFELGSSNGYGPVSVTFANVLAAGRLTAGSSNGDHPGILAGDLIAARSVNVHWNFTPAPELTFDAYNVVFNYNAADLDPGVSPALLGAGYFSVDAWTYPAVAARTDTSVQLDGLTTFSGFQLAELGQAQPQLTLSIQRLPSGLALLEIQGGSALVCRIEATSTLGSNWQEIGTATVGLGGLQTYLDLDATNAAVRFYRVVTP